MFACIEVGIDELIRAFELAVRTKNEAKRPNRLRPFLKWAGGKRWLVDRHPDLLPTFSGRYLEPFLGGGSVFFHVRPTGGLLSDANSRLIECYQQVQEDYAGIVELLTEHHRRHNKDYYYEVRATAFDDPSQRAAQFLYLNRTCWNGLYRVNQQGKFNVPIGTKTTVVFPHDNFAAISQALADIELRVCDFEETVQEAGEGDFLFVDPPYTVKHNFNGFVKYNEKIFSWEDQVRLRDSLREAANRGARVVVANAAHASVEELYEGLGVIHRLKRGSVISGKAEARGIYEEILVVI